MLVELGAHQRHDVTPDRLSNPAKRRGPLRNAVDRDAGRKIGREAQGREPPVLVTSSGAWSGCGWCVRGRPRARPAARSTATGGRMTAVTTPGADDVRRGAGCAWSPRRSVGTALRRPRPPRRSLRRRAPLRSRRFVGGEARDGAGAWSRLSAAAPTARAGPLHHLVTGGECLGDGLWDGARRRGDLHDARARRARPRAP